MAPGDLRGIRLLQAGVWLATVLLLWKIADRELGRGLDPGWRRTAVALTPALLFGLYRPGAVYAASIMLETPLVFLLAAILALLPGGGDDRPGRPWPWLLIGLLAGLGGLLRGTFLVLVPVLAWVGWRPEGPGLRRRLTPVVLLLGGGAAVLAPAIVHNTKLAGRLSPPTLNAGVNLYIGNGPEANGFYVAAIPGDWRRDPAGRAFLAQRLDLPAVSLAQADSIWGAEARRQILADPGRALGLWVRKVRLHLQGWEIDQLTPLAAWPQAAPALKLLPVSYALIAALALGGAVLAASGRPRPGGIVVVWILLSAALIAGQSLFFVVSRYRLVLVPLLALLAGSGLRRFFEPPPARWLPKTLAVLVPVLLVIPWGLGAVRSHLGAMALANEARRWAELGASGETGETGAEALHRARDLYRSALAQGADGPAPWLGLAMLEMDLGRAVEAEKVLRDGLDAVPDNLDLQKALIARLLQEGGEAEALPLALATLRAHPRDADTLHNSAVLLAGAGRLEEALLQAEDLAAGQPGDVRGYIDRGVILARLGRPAEARTSFLEGLDRFPAHPDLVRNLAVLEARSDQRAP